MPEPSRESFGDEQSYITYMRSLRETEMARKRDELENKASKKRRGWGARQNQQYSSFWLAKQPGISERIRKAYRQLYYRERRAYQIAANTDGYYTRQRARDKRKKEARRDHYLEQGRRCYARHAELRRWEARLYYHAHCEERKAYRQANSEKYRERWAMYYDSHHAELLESYRLRRLRMTPEEKVIRNAKARAAYASVTPEERTARSQKRRDEHARKKAQRLAQQEGNVA